MLFQLVLRLMVKGQDMDDMDSEVEIVQGGQGQWNRDIDMG